MHPLVNALSHRPHPEALELAWRYRELAALRAELAEREAELDSLRRLLHSFEGRYIRQVGVLYVQLDDWEFRLEELLAGRDRRAPEEVSYWAADRLLEADVEPEPAAHDRSASSSLRALFRAVARRIHPDRALDAKDERRRTALMAQANDALRRLDAELLERMLHTHDAPGAYDPRADLARVQRLIATTQTDLASLAAEHSDLAASEMAQLYDTTAAAARNGQDHLAAMAARVKGAIGAVMGRFERESSPNRRPAPVDPASLLSAEVRPASRLSSPRR